MQTSRTPDTQESDGTLRFARQSTSRQLSGLAAPLRECHPARTAATVREGSRSLTAVLSVLVVLPGLLLSGGFPRAAGGTEKPATSTNQAAARTPASPVSAAEISLAGTSADTADTPEPSPADIDLAQLRMHVQTLASDALEGREAGTRGGQAAGSYLATRFRKLELVPAGDEQSWFQYFRENYRNVLAKLPGTSVPSAARPGLQSPVIVLGAHYDHVGYGRKNNSRGPLGQIHNGADDNASGVAVLLEVARVLQQRPEPLNCTVLFACWDAEEQGLLGSRHWLEHTTLPPEQIRLSLNLDMVGRLRNERVEVSGVRSAQGLRELLTESNRETSLQLDCLWNLIADSDHYPFIERQVPTLMFHTGKHPEYHRPADDVHLLNLEGMQQIARMVLAVIRQADQNATGLRWRDECLTETDDLRLQVETPLAPRPSRLGVTSWRVEEDGLVPVSLAAGGPAERAGLQPGDLVLEFAGEPVSTVQQLQRLVFSAPGQVDLLVRRDGEAGSRPILVELAGAPLRFGIHWRTDPAEPGQVILDRVTAGSPADEAGLATGDRISRINGHRFRSHREFHELVTRTDWPEHAAGQLVLETERDGRTRTITIVPAALSPAPTPTLSSAP